MIRWVLQRNSKGGFSHRRNVRNGGTRFPAMVLPRHKREVERLVFERYPHRRWREQTSDMLLRQRDIPPINRYTRSYAWVCAWPCTGYVELGTPGGCNQPAAVHRGCSSTLVNALRGGYANRHHFFSCPDSPAVAEEAVRFFFFFIFRALTHITGQGGQGFSVPPVQLFHHTFIGLLRLGADVFQLTFIGLLRLGAAVCVSQCVHAVSKRIVKEDGTRAIVGDIWHLFAHDPFAVLFQNGFSNSYCKKIITVSNPKPSFVS